jgi:hypothetical protein
MSASNGSQRSISSETAAQIQMERRVANMMSNLEEFGKKTRGMRIGAGGIGLGFFNGTFYILQSLFTN